MKKYIAILICISMILSFTPVIYAADGTNIAFALDTSETMNLCDPDETVPSMFAALPPLAQSGTYFSVVTNNSVCSLTDSENASNALLKTPSYSGQDDLPQLLAVSAATLAGGEKQKVILLSAGSWDNELVEEAQALEKRGYTVYLIIYEPDENAANRLMALYEHVIIYDDTANLPDQLAQISLFSRAGTSPMAMSSIAPMAVEAEISADTTFSDVPSTYWAALYIYDLVRRGAIQGYGDGSFGPDDTTTVEQFLVMVISLAQIESPYGTWESSDTSNWSEKYVQYANENGLLTDAPASAPISREQAFYIMYKIFTGSDCQSWNRLKNAEPKTSDPAPFTDVASVTAAYADAVENLYQFGIVAGYPDGTLQPGGETTRAEMAKLLFDSVTPNGALVIDENGTLLVDIAAGLETITIGAKNDTANEYGANAYQFTAGVMGCYAVSCTNDFLPMVFRMTNNGEESYYTQIYPEPNLEPEQYLLNEGETVIVAVSGGANQSYTLTIDEPKEIKMNVSDLKFTPVGNGTFIYCNNPESLTSPSNLADNGADSSLLMHVSDLTPDRNGSNQYTFAGFGYNKIQGDKYRRITFDLQFLADSEAEVEITALGVQWPSGISWASMNAYADYVNQKISGIDGAEGSFGVPQPFSYRFTLNGNSAWLSDMVGGDWEYNAYMESPIFLITDFKVISGSVDLNWMAYQAGNRSNISDTTYAPYRWDRQYKGVATSLPKMHADMDYFLDDSIAPGGKLSAVVYNTYNPDGATVTQWSTGINPQSDKYGAAYNGAESAMLPLEYYDGQKWQYYGSGVPDSEREDTWIFDTTRTDFRQQVVSAYNVSGDGINRQLQTTGTPSEDYKPNAPMEQLSAYDMATLNDPDYDIGYGKNVPSFFAAANLGNYGVELEYTVTFHNLGSAKTITYYADGPGNYIIHYNGTRQNKGEQNTSVPMATFDVPSDTTTTVTFSVVLPTASAAALNNYFQVD